ncbi:19255_t:CDS:2 [Gigaspora rosea]|nr:19255_t:CDS:2 [Gigaspora rosea]
MTASTSTSTLTKAVSKNSKKASNSIDNFLIRSITVKEKSRFEQLLLRMTVSNGWSFQNLDLSHEQKLKNDNIGVTLVFDRWKNVLKQHIFGSLLILSTGESLVWKTIDISSERERIVETIPKIESMISEMSEIGAKLFAIVPDSALAYSATAHELPLDTSACNSDDELDQSSTHLDELYLPHNITSILLNDNFWQSIKELYSLLHPYCEALNKLQSDTTRFHKYYKPLRKKQKPCNISLIPAIEPANSQEPIEPNKSDDLNELDEEDNSDIISDNWEEQLYDWEQILVDEETAMLEEEVEHENNKYRLSGIEKPIWAVIPKTKIHECRWLDRLDF